MLRISFMRFSLLLAFLMLGSRVMSQAPIGQWQMHFTYSAGLRVTLAGDKVYCITAGGLFAYNRADNSVQPLTKIDGLSDVLPQQVAYDKETKQTIISYANGNLDVIDAGSAIHNIPDLKLKTIIGDKTVFSIYIDKSLAYLCCGFAIVVVDLQRYEIKDTYYFGPGNSAITVFQLTRTGNTFFAATLSGIYQADANDPFLANADRWTKHGIAQQLPNIAYSTSITSLNANTYALVKEAGNGGQNKILRFDGIKWNSAAMYAEGCQELVTVGNEILAVQNFTVFRYGYPEMFLGDYPTHQGSDKLKEAIVDEQGVCWQADANYGLVRRDASGTQVFAPSGPFSGRNTQLRFSKGKLIVGTASISSHNYVSEGLQLYDGKSWSYFNKYSTTGWGDTILDCFSGLYHPLNNKFYVASFRSGLVELNGQTVLAIYTEKNSPIKRAVGDLGTRRVNDIAFDGDNNLWLLNDHSTAPVLKLDSKGKFSTYSFPGAFPDAATTEVGRILVDSYGKKWVTLINKDRGGLLVFDEREGSSASLPLFKRMNMNVLAGSEYSNIATDLAEDRDGNIWVTTSKGLYVYYNSGSILEEEEPAPQQIKVVQDGVVQYLLESDYINCIEIDGANRKWFGTINGVWLFSADGTKAIRYFNSSNSPLPSDNVLDIAIDPVSGAVYFSTDKGLASFRGDATAGGEVNEGVMVYPNPVRHEYTGLIGIKGLVQDANVKITDINGVLVYQTVAKGGTATWDGKNFEGEKAATGVYLVFITNSDGTQTQVEKILFIH